MGGEDGGAEGEEGDHDAVQHHPRQQEPEKEGKHYLSEFKDQQNTLFLSSAENVVLINNVNLAFRYSSASNLRIL